MPKTALLLLTLAALVGPLAVGCASPDPAPTAFEPTTPTTSPTTGAASTQPGGGQAAGGGGLGEMFASLSDQITGRTPSYYLRLIRSANAGARIRGINGLVDRDFGKQPVATRVYKALAENDPDPLVRALAVRALNRSRDRTAIPLLIRGLSHPDERVRLESAKALLRMPDRTAIGPLLEVLRRPDETRDVRIAAVDALRHYKNLEVARTLASLLAERDFSIVWQSRRSLRDITQKDFRYDEAKWLTYLTNPDQPLS